jgi:hypothetical protein
VCFGVMYSGEYNVSDVTLSMYPCTPGRLKRLPDHGGNRTRATFGMTHTQNIMILDLS